MSNTLNPAAQWVADFRWAMNQMSARRFRRGLGFAERVKFDDAYRPLVKNAEEEHLEAIGAPFRRTVIAYPDAIYHTSIDDLIRAMRATMNEGLLK